MRLRLWSGIGERDHTLGFDRRHAFLDLQNPFDHQVRRTDDGRALAR